MVCVVLNSTFVKTAVCPEGKNKIEYFDKSSTNLSLEVRASGGKTYYRRYRDARGRLRQIKLGNESDLSLNDARRLSAKVGLQVAMGEDPLQKKKDVLTAPTFTQFIEAQYLPYVRAHKRSWTTDISILKNHLLPRFGDRYLDEIVRTDIQKMHLERRMAGAAPASANRLVVLMRFIFNLALEWETPGVKANPCKGVPLMEENNKNERYLSIDEAQRLYEAVCKSDNPMLKFIVPMLILTGARKREVLDSKWADFDLERKHWRIPMTKSGRARHVPLSDGAQVVLSAVPRLPECEWAFPNPDTSKPYVSIYYSWDTARKIAGLADVRMHDLRHSFASLLINSGRTLYEVQRLLGHTQIKTTQRYAHLSEETLLAAANAATQAVGGVMLPQSTINGSVSQ
jgi:integrase